MDLSAVSQFIQSFGFPIAMCGALMWYIWKAELRHKEEIDRLSDAVNNNTIVMTKLIDKIGGIE